MFENRTCVRVPRPLTGLRHQVRSTGNEPVTAKKEAAEIIHFKDGERRAGRGSGWGKGVDHKCQSLRQTGYGNGSFCMKNIENMWLMIIWLFHVYVFYYIVSSNKING